MGRSRSDSRDRGKRRRDDSYEDDRRYGGDRGGYNDRGSDRGGYDDRGYDRRASSPHDSRRRTRSPPTERRHESIGYTSSSSTRSAPAPATVAAPIGASVATAPRTGESSSVVPPSDFNWENPEEVYDALCRTDNEVLPPGWEKVSFKGATIYLDHLRREAFEEQPWVVWERRSKMSSR